MRVREDTIAWEMSYCQHYDPQPGTIEINCKAGMDIKSIRLPRNGDVFGQPCIRGHLLPDPLAVCPHWLRRTREMGEARADAIEQSMRRMRLVGPVVSEWR